jgi:ferredoxin-NADP reductase
MTELFASANVGVHWQTAKIVDIVPQTRRIKSFFFSFSKPFIHRAGQHVDLRLTAPDGYTAMRSYSIASPPGAANEIELAIERLDDGEVSPFFHDVVEIGDEIELRGPLGGHFVWSTSEGGPLLLIGGGAGVVPLMAMLRHLWAEVVDIPTVLLLSAPRWEDVLYRDELVEMDQQFPAFTLVLTLTREPSNEHGHYGRRIDTAMMAAVLKRLPRAPEHIFICGSNAFVNAAADGAVASGAPAWLIRTERYGGSDETADGA